jgi:hypothetical protein
MQAKLAGKSNNYFGRIILWLLAKKDDQALVRILLLECYLLSEVSTGSFYLLLLFYRLLSVTLISESLKLPFR